MPQDFRNRAQPSSKSKKAVTPAWVPFFYGFLMGSTLMGVAWYGLTPEGTSIVWPEFAAEKIATVKKVVTVADVEPKRPRFDFYTILPEMEFVISDDDVAPVTSKNKKSVQKQTKKMNYRLQVGSFKRMIDADRQKARLALLGVEADIQKVDIGQGDIYYRVLTQAVLGKVKLNRTRQLLKKNKISSLVVQIRN